MPLWKWVLKLFVSLILAFLLFIAVAKAMSAINVGWLKCLAVVFYTAAMIALYALFVRLFEGNWPMDIPMRKMPLSMLSGFGLASALFVLIVMVMSAIGCYRIESFGLDSTIGFLGGFFTYLAVSTIEEIIFRGVLFRWIDRRFGFVAALIVSSFMFGFMHIQTGTWWLCVSLAITLGFTAAASYKLSGNLWMPIAIHWGWNFTQGNIFGFAISNSH